MKNDILLTAAVLRLIGSFVPLSICQSLSQPAAATSLADCAHRPELVGKLVIEHMVVSPGWGKTTDPKIDTNSAEVQEETVAQPLKIIIRGAEHEACILREDWDSTRASVDNEK